MPDQETSKLRFTLGRTVITANAAATIPELDVIVALRRHHTGDWGDLDAADKAANEEALRNGGRLFSAYHSTSDRKFYIITEWDRSITTVLLPEDY